MDELLRLLVSARPAELLTPIGLIHDVLRARFSATGVCGGSMTVVGVSLGLVETDVDADDELVRDGGLRFVMVPSVDDGESDAKAFGKQVSALCWDTGRFWRGGWRRMPMGIRVLLLECWCAVGSDDDGNGSGAGANVVGALDIDPLIANASFRRRSISIGMGCGIVGVRIAALAVVAGDAVGM